MIQKAPSQLSQEISDPRYFQILYLGIFLVYGVGFLGWEADVYKYAAIFLVALFTQLTFGYFTTPKIQFYQECTYYSPWALFVAKNGHSTNRCHGGKYCYN